MKSKTQEYIKPLIYIGKELEKIYDKIDEEIKKGNDKLEQIRLFNVLPLRTNIVSKNICIDSCAL